MKWNVREMCGKGKKYVERRWAMCVGDRGNAAESAGVLSSSIFVDGVSAGSSSYVVNINYDAYLILSVRMK